MMWPVTKRAFSLMTPYQWQKELYVNILLNQAVALYRQAEQKPHPEVWYGRALQCLEKSEAMLGNLGEESYFANYAREQCRRMRPVIEEALER